MLKQTAHRHTYDLHPNATWRAEGLIRCTICGFSTPGRFLTSRTLLDALVARPLASAAVLQSLGIDVKGNPIS